MKQDLAYYSAAREDVVRLVPQPVERALEIGCGVGNTLKLLKDKNLVAWTGGVEIESEPAAEAAKHLDKIWTGNVETMDLEAEITLGSLDLIILMDVLEHLIDPWTMMKRITPWLTDRGAVIANIPNVRSKDIVGPLIFGGRWDYADRGLMDRTHLRWFTRETMQELMECGGLTVTVTEPIPALKPWKNKWIYTKLTGGFLRDFWPSSFMMRAERGQETNA